MTARGETPKRVCAEKELWFEESSFSTDDLIAEGAASTDTPDWSVC